MTDAPAAQDQVLRGGATGDDDVHVTSASLIPGIDYMDVDSDVEHVLPGVVADGVVQGAVQIDDIAGNIDGVRHVAAWTNGDGACGLHAVWGRCCEAGAQLYAGAARQ